MDYPTCAFLCNSLAINFSFRWWGNYYKTYSRFSFSITFLSSPTKMGVYKKR